MRRHHGERYAVHRNRPRCTIYRIISPDAAISKRLPLASRIIFFTVPFPSTCPCTMWPPKRDEGVSARSRLTGVPCVNAPSVVTDSVTGTEHGKRIRSHAGDSLACAINRYRIANRRCVEHTRRFDRHIDAACRLDTRHFSYFLNYPCKHCFTLSPAPPRTAPGRRCTTDRR